MEIPEGYLLDIKRGILPIDPATSPRACHNDSLWKLEIPQRSVHDYPRRNRAIPLPRNSLRNVASIDLPAVEL